MQFWSLNSDRSDWAGMEVLLQRTDDRYAVSTSWCLTESKLNESWGRTVVSIDTESIQVSLAGRQTEAERKICWWKKQKEKKEGKELSWAVRGMIQESTGVHETELQQFRPLFPDNGNYFPGLTHGPNLLHSQLMLTTRARRCMFLWREIACKRVLCFTFSAIQA